MQKIKVFIILLFIGVISYSQEYNRTIGNGNYHGVVVTSSSSESNSKPEVTLDGLGLMPNLAAASRFLAQSTLGADYETINETAEIGYRNWLDEQLNLPVKFSLLANCNDIINKHKAFLIATGGDIKKADGDDSYHVRNYFLFSWWKYVMDAEDVLRSKVALALSEIVVVSAIPDFSSEPLGLSSYYDILIKNAFGNYRNLLEEVTFHPIMGKYLTFLNNRKTNIDKNRFPDENYAREIMQLFTIGLYELNTNGTKKTDSQGNSIPTYDNDDIAEFAKIFTGLTWSDQDKFGQGSRKVGYYSFTYPMRMHNDEHEPGEKYLLNGFIVPDRNPVNGMADINDALDNLFNHPNVGPFLARRLIQRLVTSNPSPGYIERVALAFNNNGVGERGDLKAVVKAILMDEEARSCTAGIYDGKLKEPINRHVQLLRSFNAFSASGEYRYTINESYLDATDQRVLHSPSVFNFFLPDYAPAGLIDDAGLVAPEFQIVHSATLMGYANAVIKWTFENNLVGKTRLFPDEPVSDEEANLRLDLNDELKLLSEGRFEELIERLNLILMHGQMSMSTRKIILDSIGLYEHEDDLFKLNMCIFLTMVSPEYLILK